MSVFHGMSEKYLKTFDRKNKRIERRIVEKERREENVIEKMVEGTVGRYNNKLKTEWNEEGRKEKRSGGMEAVHEVAVLKEGQA